MALLFNVCLILFGLAGVGAAVAAPIIVMSTGNKTSTTASQRPSSGTSTVSLDISECSGTNFSSSGKVDFGSSRPGQKICGKVEGDSTLSTNKGDYTTLFKETWGKTAQDGSNSSFGNWKTSCTASGNSKWKIGGSSDIAQDDADHIQVSEQSLGLCNESSAPDNNVPFAHNKDNKSISVCVGVSNCGQLPSESQSTLQLQSQNESKGKTVNFYKSN